MSTQVMNSVEAPRLCGQQALLQKYLRRNLWKTLNETKWNRDSGVESYSEDIVSVFRTYAFPICGVGLASREALWCRDSKHAYVSLQPPGTVADITNQTQMPLRCSQHRTPGATDGPKLWEDQVWLWELSQCGPK